MDQDICVHCLGDIDPETDTYTCYNGLYVCEACEEEESGIDSDVETVEAHEED